MRRSKSAKKSHKPNTIGVRRSERLADKLKKLPDYLILKILSNIQEDIKTLIRCSSVCKYLHSVISKFETLSLSFLSGIKNDDDDGDNDGSLICSKPHLHIRLAAFPPLMKVFSNLTFLDINICPCPSSSLYVSRLNCMIGDGDSDGIYCQLVYSVHVGVFSTSRNRDVNVPLKLNRKSGTSFVKRMMFFFKKMVPHWPKTLKKVMILSGNVQGSGSRGGGFLVEEKLDKFTHLNLVAFGYDCWLNWLNDPRNVTYWFKNPVNDEKSCLRENVSLVHGFEFRCVKNRVTTETVMAESVLKELFRCF